MHFRCATPDDADLLAGMNHSLIQDKGHRKRMTPQQRAARMSDWLQSDYRAVVFEIDGQPRGYALIREEADPVYLGQFYVVPARRRQGIGRAVVE